MVQKLFPWNGLFQREKWSGNSENLKKFFNVVKIIYFLATLVALHFTLVSKSVSEWVVVSD